MNNLFNRDLNETPIEYIKRICSLKYDSDLTWEDIKNLINDELRFDYSESYYRKHYKDDTFPEFLNSTEDTGIVMPEPEYSTIEAKEESELDSKLFELRKERIKASDERSQMMAAVRKMAREETLLEIAKQIAGTLKDKPILPNYEYIRISGNKAAVLQISDWHYGIEVNNPWNVYNPEIAKDRIIKLRSRVVNLIKETKVKDLYIANLGDLISGRIHETIRIQNRIDVITQCLEVTEILVEFLAYLSQYVNIKYISTSDNHSRMEPKKDLSLDLESLTRVIEPLLKARIENLKHEKKCKNIEFIDSPFGPDIATFEVMGYKVGAVHGHKDSPKMVVNNISLMTRNNYDLILSAHLHHFSCDESFNAVVVSNGSLMGVDDYAETLRVCSKPSQNFIVISEDSPAESIHRIVVE